MSDTLKESSDVISILPPLTIPSSSISSTSSTFTSKNFLKNAIIEDDENCEDDEDDEDEDIQDSYSNEDLEDIQNETLKLNKNIDPNASYFATFVDGSALRYLIDYLRNIGLDATFLFTKDYITCQKEDDDKTIFNDIRLKTYELTDYEFDSFNSEIATTINLSELRNKTRTVGKKEQLDVYRRPEEPSNFYIQVRSQEKGAGDNPVFYCMPVKSENVTLYELPKYSRGKHNPNCTIYQSDFSKVCKALVANKCSYAQFIGYEKGIIIKGYAADGKINMVKEYGKCRVNPASKTSTSKSVNNVSDRNTIKPQVAAPKLNVRDAHEVERFRVHISNVKSLAKLNGFSPNGTIKIYIEQGLPMRLSCAIGSFGKLNILIRNS